MGVDCQPRLGVHAAAVDVSEPQAILTEALRLAKATPQECGVLSTKHLQGAFWERRRWTMLHRKYISFHGPLNGFQNDESGVIAFFYHHNDGSGE